MITVHQTWALIIVEQTWALSYITLLVVGLFSSTQPQKSSEELKSPTFSRIAFAEMVFVEIVFVEIVFVEIVFVEIVFVEIGFAFGCAPAATNCQKSNWMR